MFIERICERENQLVKRIKDIKMQHPGQQIWIWGGAEGNGGKLGKILEQYDISITGYVVNRPYSTGLCLEELLEKASESIVLVVAYGTFKRPHMEQLLEQYDEKIYDILVYDFLAMIHDNGRDYQEVLNQADAYEELYCSLCDRKSKDILIAFINQQISVNPHYLERLCDDVQYFDEDIVRFGEHEIFVDCGAFTGDTAMMFTEQIAKQNGSYDEIISMEPEKENMKKCLDRGLERHTCIPKGAYDHNTVLHFHADTSGSYLAESGEECVEVTTVDEVTRGRRITMIKMDIEGSELAALKGAEQTIRAYHPRLAICVYHKREDLLTISSYISSLYPGYQFYMRTYPGMGDIPTVEETVLYAIS